MLEQALDRVDEGVMIIDADFKIVFLNRMCEAILDIKRENALGKNIDEFFDNPPEHTRALQHTLEKNEEFVHEVLPYKWGKYDKYLKQETKLLKKEGKVIGAMTEFNDITDFVRREQKLVNMLTERSATIIPLSLKTGILPLRPLEMISDNLKPDIQLSKILDDAVRQKIEKLAIDMSFIPFTSSEDSEHFYQLLKTLNMMGIEVVITGIKPDLARDTVTKGRSFSNYRTYTHLSQALDYFNLSSSVE